MIQLEYGKDGLIPVIAQDFETKEVLMLAYMNAPALQKTLSEGRMCYYSRRRDCLWVKGETSGHFQTVMEARYDCDCDALLFLVRQEGVACHTGEATCFYRSLTDKNADIPITLNRLFQIIKDRRDNPKEGSYTNYLLDKGLDKILKKVGEETAEVIIAAKNLNNNEIISETADLMYHLSVLLVNEGVTWDDVLGELTKRHTT